MAFEFDLQSYDKEKLREEFRSPLIQWASLIIVITVLFFLIYEPYLTYRQDYRDMMLTTISKIERLQKLKDNRAVLESNVKLINEKYLRLNSGLLDSKNYNRGVAEQVGIIEQIFRAKNISFNSRRFLEPQFSPWLGEAVVSQWGFNGNSQDVMDFIYALAVTNKIIVPEKLSITLKSDQHAEISATLVSYRKIPINELRFKSRSGGEQE
ncbi:hypothetical protein [Aeromonas salmonicida]|uniref:hypothetical protein n=1 Tax=Aeromonas salmonicida TaxID=645 RepID=UPI001788D2B1|nr:hypothetical protein [Aeromonas salmonicida]QOI91759.1 hypothetical protein G7042_11375 [Aeromonas salmonicida subsp. masoucida]